MASIPTYMIFRLCKSFKSGTLIRNCPYIQREKEKNMHMHMHTHTHPFLCISILQERIKRQSCRFAYHENVKQQSRSINFCDCPPGISVCSMNILCGMQVLNGQCRIRFRKTIPIQQTDLKLWLVGFCKPVPSLVLCSQQSSSQTSDHFWTLCNISCLQKLNYAINFFARPSF